MGAAHVLSCHLCSTGSYSMSRVVFVMRKRFKSVSRSRIEEQQQRREMAKTKKGKKSVWNPSSPTQPLRAHEGWGISRVTNFCPFRYLLRHVPGSPLFLCYKRIKSNRAMGVVQHGGVPGKPGKVPQPRRRGLCRSGWATWFQPFGFPSDRFENRRSRTWTSLHLFVNSVRAYIDHLSRHPTSGSRLDCSPLVR